jgi:hypothetical protein
MFAFKCLCCKMEMPMALVMVWVCPQLQGIVLFHVSFLCSLLVHFKAEELGMLIRLTF